ERPAVPENMTAAITDRSRTVQCRRCTLVGPLARFQRRWYRRRHSQAPRSLLAQARSDAMPSPRLTERVEILEQRVGGLETLPARVDAVELQIVHLRTEMRAGFADVRQEIRAGQEVIREEIHAGQEVLREEIHAGQEVLREEIHAGQEVLREEIRAG